MVVPIRLLPWLFLLAGAFGLFSGDEEISVLMSLVLILIGGVWLYLARKSKVKSASAPSPTDTSNVGDVPPAPDAIAAAQPVAPAICACGEPIQPGMAFCTRYGKKVEA